MLGDNRNAALDGAFDLGAIMSFLRKDPNHILMVLDGFNGRSLFKVDLDTGHGKQMERPSESVVGWWLDVDGNPVVRVTESRAAPMRLFRKDAEGKWKKFHSMRIKEMKEQPEYESARPFRPARQVLRAGAPARQGTRRPLSIRPREREVRRAAGREPEVRPDLARSVARRQERHAPLLRRPRAHLQLRRPEARMRT